ncbi:hypothetical protein KM043_006812 [Ampulex compressa]|nr:hypothetical protein KM043_006812 [Ampulex compressa]
MGNTESHKRTEYHNHVTIHETPISPAYEGYTIRISSPSNKRSKKQELPSRENLVKISKNMCMHYNYHVQRVMVQLKSLL